MKINVKRAVISYLSIVVLLITIITIKALVTKDKIIIVNNSSVLNYNEFENEPIVYDGMTVEDLGKKLDSLLNDELDGKGQFIAEYATEVGVDPYLATAILLQETGCYWKCSTLVKACNNVGGMKGSPSCLGGSYKAYSTLDAGIKSFIDNIYNNYYLKGLFTAEQMNKKYAASTVWSTRVNNYIEKIKAS